MIFPQPHPNDRPVRILFVFAWLAGGAEESELRFLARSLDRARYRIDALPCLKLEGVPDPLHQALTALGIHVDLTAYDLGFDDTIRYLTRKVAGYDIVVSCQNVADIYPALENMRHRPPLIEHGRLVSEALSGPKHFTTCYVGTTEAVRAAAASGMPDSPERACLIPLTLDTFRGVYPLRQPVTRSRLELAGDAVVIGWAGPLHPAERVEDFLHTAALVRIAQPEARFVVAGTTDATDPDHAVRLRAQVVGLGLSDVVTFLTDPPNLPEVLAGLDILVSNPQSPAQLVMIAQAGANRLPVVAIADPDARHEVPHGLACCLVAAADSQAAAHALHRLSGDARLRRRLGLALHAEVAALYAPDVILRKWEAVFDAALAAQPAPAPALFQSFVQGGFESSTHRLRSGKRLDVIAATQHDVHARADYRQLGDLGLRTVRDGIRWHLIETSPGRYDFSSFTAMARAAQQTGTQVIWDLLHYGWPDDIDILSPAFPDRFAAFARATARIWCDLSDDVPFWCPVNEISFFSWGGGDVGYLNPFATGRGFELKVQLARASIAAMHALRDVDPRTRFVHCEPLIAIHHDPATGRPRAEAEGWHQAQFQAYELISGQMWPQIGGDPSLLDIIGVNYYPPNQWIHAGPTIDVDHPFYRPLSDLLFETHARYNRPLFVAETGVEDQRRAPWLHYVAAEVARARRRGVPVEGICLYPILNHPGWDDDRACQNGLLTQAFNGQFRDVDPALCAAVIDVVSRYAPAPKANPMPYPNVVARQSVVQS